MEVSPPDHSTSFASVVSPLSSKIADVLTLPEIAAQALLDALRDGGNLPRIVAGADEEVVGEAASLAKVEYHEIDCLLVPGSRNRGGDRLRQSQRSRFSHLSRRGPRRL